MSRKSVAILFAIVGLFGISGTLFAHHSDAAFFSRDDWKTISGTVKEFRWMNPHPLLIIDVKQDGRVEEWRIEFHAPSKMARQYGWAKSTFAPGDQVTIYGHPWTKGGAEGHNVLAPVKLTHSNGKVDDIDAPNNY
jgi:hypothetical protein